MTLTKEDKDWLQDELKKCSDNLSPQTKNALSHFTGMLKDVGDGDYDKGVETFRVIGKRNNAYIRWTRRIEAAGVATITGDLVIKIWEISQ